MELSVAYDQKGNILAAFVMEPSLQRLLRVGEAALPIRAHIEIDNASVAALEVPAEFHGKKLHEFLHHLHVDVAACRLVRVR
jgi:hypothetical protein